MSLRSFYETNNSYLITLDNSYLVVVYSAWTLSLYRHMYKVDKSGHLQITLKTVSISRWCIWAVIWRWSNSSTLQHVINHTVHHQVRVYWMTNKIWQTRLWHLQDSIKWNLYKPFHWNLLLYIRIRRCSTALKFNIFHFYICLYIPEDCLISYCFIYFVCVSFFYLDLKLLPVAVAWWWKHSLGNRESCVFLVRTLTASSIRHKSS